jgi:hypothetical protein
MFVFFGLSLAKEKFCDRKSLGRSNQNGYLAAQKNLAFPMPKDQKSGTFGRLEKFLTIIFPRRKTCKKISPK